MPGVDGVGVVHPMRQSGKSAMAVMGISDTPWECKEADFNVILEKPLAITTLVAHVAVSRPKRKKHPATGEVAGD